MSPSSESISETARASYPAVCWAEWRALFPALDKSTYLDTAYFGPISTLAARAASQYYADFSNDTVGRGHAQWETRLEEIRNLVARLLGAHISEVGFVANTSTAMTWAALILEGAGGAVLAAAEEHPTVVTPWLARGFRVDVAPPDGSGAFTAESYARCLRPDTKIIAVSHVRFNDGQINEIEKLAELIHFRGGYLVVDASQSAGVLPVHATSGADIIGFAGFKWLNAGSGTGAIYVRQALLERFGMPIGGNRSRKTQDLIQIDRFEPLLEAKALELGSLAVPNILALGASLDLIESIGSTAIQARIIELTRRLQIGLKENHIVIAGVESDGSPIISVSVVDPPAAMRALERRNIAVSLRSGRLRIAVSWYNNEADIDTCLNAMTDGPNLGRGP